MTRGLRFWVYVVEGLHYLVKTKALISFVVTVKLICVFVFAYAKIRFPHDAAHICAAHICSLAFLSTEADECSLEDVQYLPKSDHQTQSSFIHIEPAHVSQAKIGMVIVQYKIHELCIPK